MRASLERNSSWPRLHRTRALPAGPRRGALLGSGESVGDGQLPGAVNGTRVGGTHEPTRELLRQRRRRAFLATLKLELVDEVDSATRNEPRATCSSSSKPGTTTSGGIPAWATAPRGVRRETQKGRLHVGERPRCPLDRVTSKVSASAKIKAQQPIAPSATPHTVKQLWLRLSSARSHCSMRARMGASLPNGARAAIHDFAVVFVAQHIKASTKQTPWKLLPILEACMPDA